MSWDFTKNTWDMFALCFLMHYNNIQQSPKSFCLFNYLSRAINSVESKRRTNRKIIIHPFLKELHEVTLTFSTYTSKCCAAGSLVRPVTEFNLQNWPYQISCSPGEVGALLLNVMSVASYFKYLPIVGILKEHNFGTEFQDLEETWKRITGVFSDVRFLLFWNVCIFVLNIYGNFFVIQRLGI